MSRISKLIVWDAGTYETYQQAIEAGAVNEILIPRGLPDDAVDAYIAGAVIGVKQAAQRLGYTNQLEVTTLVSWSVVAHVLEYNTYSFSIDAVSLAEAEAYVKDTHPVCVPCEDREGVEFGTGSYDPNNPPDSDFYFL